MKANPIDPWIVYRAQMRAIRKQYAKETCEVKLKEKVTRLSESKQRLEVQHARINDIQEYKKAKEDSLLTVFPKKKDKGKKIHPVFNMTMDELKDYYAARNLNRFSRALESAQKAQELRTQSLLHLYYEAKDFVTYANMEEKLEDVTSRKSLMSDLNNMSISEMISSKMKGSDLHLSHMISKRKEALADALNGTIANGNMGQEEILRVLNDVNHGVSRKKVSQIQVEAQKEADLESILDKMCD
jgi:hypothetical protein